MRITILDGKAGELGRLLEAPLKELFDEVQVFDRTSKEEFAQRAPGSEFLLTNKVPLTSYEMDLCPNLKYVGVMATGFNIIDLEEAARRNIAVTNVPAYSTQSVAQMTWAHILNIASRTGHYAQMVHDGAWCKSPDFSFMDESVMELSGKVMGIVGMGQIGSQVARIALAFGMKVLCVTSKSQDALPQGCLKASMEEMLSSADIVSLHCPQTPQNKGMISKQALSKMKPSAMLINTARGGLIDAEAVAEALSSGRLLAAGMDVSAIEPMPEDSPLWRLDNCFFTPHIAWASQEAIERLCGVIIKNLKAFLSGERLNRVE